MVCANITVMHRMNETHKLRLPDVKGAVAERLRDCISTNNTVAHKRVVDGANPYRIGANKMVVHRTPLRSLAEKVSLNERTTRAFHIAYLYLKCIGNARRQLPSAIAR